MQTVHKTPTVTTTARKTRDLDADLLIIPVFEDDNLSDEPDLDRALQALTEGAVLANYEGTSYKTAEQPVAWLERIEVRVGGTLNEAALERGRVFGECTNLARALSNEPGNVLTPREFAERAATL